MEKNIYIARDAATIWLGQYVFMCDVKQKIIFWQWEKCCFMRMRNLLCKCTVQTYPCSYNFGIHGNITSAIGFHSFSHDILFCDFTIVFMFMPCFPHPLNCDNFVIIKPCWLSLKQPLFVLLSCCQHICLQVTSSYSDCVYVRYQTYFILIGNWKDMGFQILIETPEWA